MRVTKLIREYVAKKVNEAYPKSEAEIRWEEKSNRVNEAITKANDLVEAYAKKIGEEINFEFGLDEGYRIKAFEGRNWFSTSYYSDDEDYQASRKAENERRKKIAETVEEILISLELGGTRADLDEMLAKVGKGE